MLVPLPKRLVEDKTSAESADVAAAVASGSIGPLQMSDSKVD